MLKIGFVNACLPQLSLEEQFNWAAENGFGAFELHAGPNTVKVDLEKVASNRDEAARIKELITNSGLEVTDIMWGGFHLHGNREKREASQNRLRSMIRAAAALDIPLVSTFIGRDPSRPVNENIELAVQVWPELLQFAAEYNIKIAIENCPMMYEWPGGLNIAYSPEIWAELFERLDPHGERLSLNFDPSHLKWLGIDYLAALRKFAPRVMLVQAKDTEILPDKLAESGIFGEGWWRYRLPGLGQVDWSHLIDTLYELDLVSRVKAINIEHEDPVWEGTVEKVQRGLLFSQNYLKKFIL
ncbi:MAG TPA: sugar phosphate isomerase/epimerase [Chloroflexia bacterium]|nr:sugar phosphate isomerase/epimerase [Chloroflexia bacterium]